MQMAYSSEFQKSGVGLTGLNQGIGQAGSGSRVEFASFPAQNLNATLFLGLFSSPLLRLHSQKQKVKFHTDLSDPLVCPLIRI